MAMAPTNHTICFLLLLITFLMISPCLSAGDTNVLFSDIGGGILDTDQSLHYKGLYYNLFMQRDCNLCLYVAHKQYWCTNTASWWAEKCQLQLKSNGELVLSGYPWPWFGPKNREVYWRSRKTSTEGSYALVLNYDGSLGVYGPPIWSVPNSLIKAKSTTGVGYSSNSKPNAVPTTDSTLWTGDIAPIGTTIANGDYDLVLHGNCNLTLSNHKTGETLWYTNTKDKYDLYDCWVTLEKNGLLEVKYIGGAPLWNSEAKGPKESQYVLSLRPDGILAIYGPPIWKVNVKKTAYYGEKIAMVTEK